jgi:hypothetical protein
MWLLPALVVGTTAVLSLPIGFYSDSPCVTKCFPFLRGDGTFLASVFSGFRAI